VELEPYLSKHDHKEAVPISIRSQQLCITAKHSFNVLGSNRLNSIVVIREIYEIKVDI
jgi:hypothetical protein